MIRLISDEQDDLAVGVPQNDDEQFQQAIDESFGKLKLIELQRYIVDDHEVMHVEEAEMEIERLLRQNDEHSKNDNKKLIGMIVDIDHCQGDTMCV